MRKKKLFCFFLLIFCTVLILPSCSYTAENFAFGTFYTIKNEGESAKKLTKEAENYIHFLDGKLSASIADSELYSLNSANAGQPVSVGEDFITLFKLAKYFNGKAAAFNPAVFPLVELWKFSPLTFTGIANGIPTEAEINSLLPLCSLDNFALNEQEKTIVKLLDGAMLDFGAIAKGYAVDVAFSVAKATKTQVNIGGTIKTDEAKTVAVASPFDGKGYFAKVIIENGSVSTSGDYERHYFYNGKKYHHIIGKDGYPSGTHDENPIVSVTVTGESAAYCDALSTIVMIDGENAEALLLELGYSALIIRKDSSFTVIGDKYFEIL